MTERHNKSMTTTDVMSSVDNLANILDERTHRFEAQMAVLKEAIECQEKSLRTLIETQDKTLRDIYNERDHRYEARYVERDRRYEDRYVERDRRYENKFVEVDRRYEQRFEAQREALTTALHAQKELTLTVFTASEKAVAKAEDAQRETNAKSNEFRGQLKDQNDTMIPRLEANARFQGLDEKFDSRHGVVERRFDEIQKNIAALREGAGLYPSRNEVSTMIESLKADITTLRDFRSAVTGAKEGTKDTTDNAKWVIGIGVSLLIVVVGIVVKLAVG